MPEFNKIKICIVVSSLGNGGAERSSALLSKMLGNLGYEVHIVSILNYLDYEYNGTLLNLGALKDRNDSIIGRFKRFKVLKDYIINQKFNLIIDGRSRPKPLKEFFYKAFIYKNQNVAFIVHSSKLESYLPKNKFVFDIVYKRAKAIICVSEDIKNRIQSKYKNDNVYTINNVVDKVENERLSAYPTTMDFDYILYYGRLEDEVKNISLLLDSYKISKLKSNGVKLVILGDGTDKPNLVNKVNRLDLSPDVMFLSFTNNPFPYIKNSRFTVLTSRYEGFPMVLLESLSVGAPVISVDCESGPNEIVKNGYNGLLVENFNEQALAEAMNSFIFDEDLYQTCKKNAQKSVEKYSVENISKEWDKLINALL